MNLLCGLAVAFDSTSANDGRTYGAYMFRRLFDLPRLAIPLVREHERGTEIGSDGSVADLGVVRGYALVTQPVPGLLVLAEVTARGGDDLVGAIAHQLSLTGWPPDRRWGLSLGSSPWPGSPGYLVPVDVSLVSRCAVDGSAILAAGRSALATWDLLTAGATYATVAALDVAGV